MFNLFIRVVDPNPDPDPPDPDPLVKGMNPDSDLALDPDPYYCIYIYNLFWELKSARFMEYPNLFVYVCTALSDISDYW